MCLKSELLPLVLSSVGSEWCVNISGGSLGPDDAERLKLQQQQQQILTEWCEYQSPSKFFPPSPSQGFENVTLGVPG